MGFQDHAGGQSDNTTVEYEMKRSKRTGWRDVIICVIIIVAALLFQETRDTRAVSVELSRDETQITIFGMDGAKHAVAFADVETLELHKDLEDFEKGEAVSAEETKRYTSGTFKNDAYGTYELHITNKAHDYIVVHMTDSVLVFNYESDETTDGLYDYLMEQIP